FGPSQETEFSADDIESIETESAIESEFEVHGFDIKNDISENAININKDVFDLAEDFAGGDYEDDLFSDDMFKLKSIGDDGLIDELGGIHIDKIEINKDKDKSKVKEVVEELNEIDSIFLSKSSPKKEKVKANPVQIKKEQKTNPIPPIKQSANTSKIPIIETKQNTRFQQNSNLQSPSSKQVNNPAAAVHNRQVKKQINKPVESENKQLPKKRENTPSKTVNIQEGKKPGNDFSSQILKKWNKEKRAPEDK
ncbi:MAG: hypothetical protein QG635_2017, partial [Bacteroidota bacterium]|nr:hypothetical protein [Bacteroidota bacterium]